MNRRPCLIAIAAVIGLACRALTVSAGVQCFEPVGSIATADVVFCVPLVPLAAHEPPGRFQSGCAQTYIIKAGDGVRGNWGYVATPLCSEGPCANLSGSNALECQLTYGAVCWPGGQGQSLPGVRRGALRDGMQARFDQDTDRSQGLCHDQYHGNGKRIIVVPLTNDPTNGRDLFRISGFAAFFLRGLPTNGDDAVEGEFLYCVAGGDAVEVGAR